MFNSTCIWLDDKTAEQVLAAIAARHELLLKVRNGVWIKMSRHTGWDAPP